MYYGGSVGAGDDHYTPAETLRELAANGAKFTRIDKGGLRMGDSRAASC
jgi:hypothetical protein